LEKNLNLTKFKIYFAFEIYYRHTKMELQQQTENFQNKSKKHKKIWQIVESLQYIGVDVSRLVSHITT
jgi:hypothetical protein